MNGDRLERVLQGGVVFLMVVSLAGGAGGCQVLPSSPTVVPTPTTTPTPYVIVYTATPSPTMVLPTRTTAPSRTPPPPPTATPSPTPTISGTVPLTTTLTPSPTVDPCQLRAWPSNDKPIKGSHMIIYAELTCQGQGVPRARIQVICYYRTLRARYPTSGLVWTDEDGVGRVEFNLTNATSGETVMVDVFVLYGSQEYQAQTSFQVQ